MQNSHALKGFVLNIGGKEEGDSILVTPQKKEPHLKQFTLLINNTCRLF